MTEYTYNKGKLKRSHLQHYIDSTFGGTGTPVWFVLGKDMDDMSMELNPDTETVKNVLDETNVNDNGYEPELDVETYCANPGDAIYNKVKDIALNRLTGEDCMTKILEVVIDKTSAPFDAWTETVMLKPQSYGGTQGSVNIPFNMTLAGGRTKGTVTFAGGVPTFTAVTTGTEG